MSSEHSFTAELFAWLNQVFRDPDVPASGFKLAWSIGQHINRETREAWPTQRTLAAATGTTEKTVQTLSRLLATRGHLEIEITHGRHRPNIYRLKWHENRKPTSGYEDEKPETHFPHTSEKTGNLADENRKSGGEKPEAHFLQNHLSEPSEEPSEVRKPPGARQLQAALLPQTLTQQRSDKRARGPTLIDPHWWPDEDDRSYAKGQGLSESEIQREAERFRNHAGANGRRQKSWSHAWRNWILKAVEFREERGVKPPAKPNGHGNGGRDAGVITDEQWRSATRFWIETDIWPPVRDRKYGPRPDAHDTLVPPHILEEFRGCRKLRDL